MPLFTLTSDFGNQTYLVSIVKACILKEVPEGVILDVSHEIAPYHLQQCSYIFTSALPYFSKGSFHFIFCGLYLSNETNLLIALVDGSYVFCVDNGFGSIAFAKNTQYYKINLESGFKYAIGDIAKMFSMASRLLVAGTPLADFCEPYYLKTEHHVQNFVIQNNEIMVYVLYIDNYKNVVLNITETQFEEARQGRKFSISFIGSDTLNTISKGYNAVPMGNKLCFFNDAGYLEIAVRGANASELFGLEDAVNAKTQYKKIKITFND